MSVEKNQLLKVGDKVKILPTILSAYPDFPYVGVVGTVCAIDNDNDSIAIVIGAIWNLYLMICQIFGNILNKSEVLLEFS